MFLLRSVEEKDLKDLYRLASILDSVNLPRDRAALRRNIRHAVASFRGRQPDKAKAVYLFVVENTRTGRVVGTSCILARHGAERAPHLFFRVGRQVRRSRSQDIRVVHRTLKLGLNKDGPSEIGGLVVLPRYRRLPDKLGKQLALVRFLYMSLHPGRFKTRVLSEFLPSFSRGKSLLWEHLGKELTGMEYHRADRLSAVNKEFILGLFPRSKFYTRLMPSKVQRILEKTGRAAMPAQRMLEAIGFRYLKQICPFDGGPHFGAMLHDIKPVKHSRPMKVRVVPGKGLRRRMREGLILVDHGGRVRALQTRFVTRAGEVFLQRQACKLLRATQGDPVVVYAFPR